MAATPYAKVLVSVNGSPNLSGGLDVPSGAEITLTPESIVGWGAAVWEFYDYPEGWEPPPGWSLRADGVIYYAGYTPPPITMPANTTLWGVWMLRLRLIRERGGDIVDESTCLSMQSPMGLRDIGAREQFQFTTAVTRLKKWLRSYQRNLRVIDSLVGGNSLTLTNSETGTLDNVPSRGEDDAPADMIRFTGSDAITVTGIANGVRGRRLRLVSKGNPSAPITLKNQNGGSIISNRIVTGTGGDLTVPAGGAVELVFDGTDSVNNRWHVVGISGGGGAAPGGSEGEPQTHGPGSTLIGTGTENGTRTQSDGEALTNDTDGQTRQIGDTFPIPDNATLVVDVDAECVQAGALKSKIISVRRAFKSAAGTITSSSQVDRLAALELGGSLAASVSITRTGATGRVDVTGVSGIGLRWRAKRELRRLLAAEAPPITAIDAMQFMGSQSYFGSVTPGVVGAFRVRFRLDSVPTASFKILAGCNTGAGGSGWLLTLEDVIGSSACGQLVLYGQVGGSFVKLSRKFFMPDDVGKVFTVHGSTDGGKAFVYLDGRKLGPGVTGSFADATQPMLIGGSSAGANSSAVTVIDVAQGSLALTPAEVLADAASPTPAFAGQTHRYVASAGIGATWNDEIGTQHLTRFGAPAPVSFTPVYGQHRGLVEIYGDSIAAGRQADMGLGNGWRRKVQRDASTAGKAITPFGLLDMAASTKDFDRFATAQGGQAMSERNATLAADLAANAPSDAATLIAYGVNDIAALNHTAATLKTDITTAVGLVNAARPGRPIFVCNVMQVATGAATSGQRAEITSFQSGFAAFISTLQATYPNVRGINTAPAVTDPDSTAVLYDGTHPSPATYAAMADIITPVLIANM